MAGTRTPRSSTRSSPRSSPKSGKSTPTAKRASALRNSITPAAIKAKSKPKKPSRLSKTSKRAAAAKTEEGGEEEEEDQAYHSATGLTETEDSSSDDEVASEDAFDPSSAEDDELIEEEEAEEVELEAELDSDDLDEEEEFVKKRKSKSGGSTGGASAKKAKTGESGKTSGKGKVGVKIEGYGSDEEEEEMDIELEEGQEIAGRIYSAPKTGQVPPGRISNNTMRFLANLQIPERNDRDWFKSHEPAFRQAEKEFKAFAALIQQQFHEADSDVAMLPPNAIVHRIYRDVRFSSDKTPYKKSFSLTTGRGGRKGIFAHYHLSISPNNRSILACGVWQPGKNEIASIRHYLQQDPSRFRAVINATEFVKLFGAAKAGKRGERRNVFGHEDELKVAPKGVDKGHKDIDLLKLRTVAVVHHFTDEEVISEDFNRKVKKVVTAMTPFVHLLNDMVSLPADNGATGAGNGNGNDNGGEDDGEDDEDGGDDEE